MTENKRFELDSEVGFIDTQKCGGGTMTPFEVVVKLNKLNDENEELKQFQEQVTEVIESKMGDNVCNDYKMEVLKEIWNELELDEVWFE